MNKEQQKYNDDLYNKLQWEEIPKNEKIDFLKGKTVVHAETVDWPIISGIVLYCKSDNGSLNAYSIDWYDTEEQTIITKARITGELKRIIEKGEYN